MIEFVHTEEKTEVYIAFTQPQQAVGISFRLKFYFGFFPSGTLH